MITIPDFYINTAGFITDFGPLMNQLHKLFTNNALSREGLAPTTTYKMETILMMRVKIVRILIRIRIYVDVRETSGCLRK